MRRAASPPAGEKQKNSECQRELRLDAHQGEADSCDVRARLGARQHVGGEKRQGASEMAKRHHGHDRGRQTRREAQCRLIARQKTDRTADQPYVQRRPEEDRRNDRQGGERNEEQQDVRRIRKTRSSNGLSRWNVAAMKSL